MPSIYTFTQKAAASGYGENKTTSHYMNQPMDAARVAIQGIGNGIQTSDASSSPVTSPVTLSSTATTLNTPESAVQITIKNSGTTNALTVSEVSATSSSVFTLETGQSQTFDCGNMAQLFLKSTSGTTADFFYTMV